MSMTPDAWETKTLRVGELFHLKRGKDWILYAGLVSDERFSIVELKSSGNRGFAWNLYYPRRAQDIVIDGIPLSVVRAEAGTLEFRTAPV